MMIELQKFLKSHPTDWENILSNPPYNIKITREEELVLFKYNQINSDFNLEIVRNCRGIILDSHNWDIVCHPFHKFGNMGESYVPEIDWDSAGVFEKVDGSLIKLYYWMGDWRIATNGTILAKNAELPFPTEKLKTFEDAFMHVFQEKYKCFDWRFLDPRYTYLFELVGPLNRVVVPYKELDVYFLSAKNNYTGEENFNLLSRFPTPKRYPLTSLDEVVKAAKDLPFSEEGYVVVDKYLNRIKIKSPAYVQIHHIRGEAIPTKRRILDLIRSNEAEEFLNYFPEYKEQVTELLKQYIWFLGVVSDQTVAFRLKKFENRKEMAKWANKYHPLPAICFQIADGKIETSKEYLDKIDSKKLLDLMEQI